MMHAPEQFRIREGRYATNESYGCNGAFQLLGPLGRTLFVIASDGTEPGAEEIAAGWEHVSCQAVAGNGKFSYIPMWPEMAHLKGLFWEPEDTVIQFHPPQSQYVNAHPNVLHLWRNRLRPTELPPHVLVGPKTAEEGDKLLELWRWAVR